MIELLSLSFNNIRSFTDKQEISFKDKGKLIQIDGKNNNTGGSSGAGKSTIFIALDYLLGISDIPATVLQSRNTKKTIEVSGDFLIDGKEVTISRSKKNGLSIVTPEETVSGNNKLAEEKLDQLIQIPRKIFKKMIHKKQKEGGFFLNLTSKEMYLFLIKTLGLEKYSENIDLISEDIKEIKKDLDKNTLREEGVSKEIDELKTLLSSIARPAKNFEYTEKDIEAIEKSIEKTKKQIEEAVSLKNSEIQLVEKPIAKNIDKTELLQKLSGIRKELKEKENKLLECSVAKAELPKLIEQYRKLSQEKKQIESNTCPTCSNHWNNEESISKVRSLTETMVGMQEKMLSLKNKQDLIERLEESIEEIKKQESDIALEINSINSKAEKEYLIKKQEYDNQISEIEHRFQLSINSKQTELLKLDNKLSLVKERISNYNRSLSDYEENVGKFNNKIQQKEQEKLLILNKISELQETHNVAEEAKRLIKSYTLQTFQETLDSIGEVATSILDNIPNTSSSSVYFEGCKETKSGSIKDEVNGMVSFDGETAVPIKSFSGGERTAIELAVDLAVIDIIESKVGKGANFYILDEPFDGLDSVCKEGCLDILSQLDTNKKIIIVDHSSELKEIVTEKITIVKDGEKSVVL